MALGYQRSAKQAPRRDLIAHIQIALCSLGRDAAAFNPKGKKTADLAVTLRELRDEQRAVGGILKETA